MKNSLIIISLILIFVGCNPQDGIKFSVINTTEKSKLIIQRSGYEIDTFLVKPKDSLIIYEYKANGGIIGNKNSISIGGIFDTLYSTDTVLTKYLQDINNWDFYPQIINENKLDLNGGVDKFTFVIKTEKIEKENKLYLKENELKKTSVLVLPPFDEIANRGISPDVRGYLETGLKKRKELELIEFPFKKLVNVSYQNIFDKKYCKSITDNFDCDIIIMSKLDFVKETGDMPRDGWNLRIKIYNVNTDTQIISRLKVDSLSNAGIKKILLETDKVITNEIKETVANNI